MESTKKILVVENDTAWLNYFERIIKALGEKREIVKVDLPQFESGFNTPKDFDDVECAFVDLELGPGVEPELNDMWGLDSVLPQIRELAPWIPVALISRYISGQLDLLCTLSVSDFDGTYPKQIISDGTRTHPEFNERKWKNISNDIKIKRNANLTGRSVKKISKLLKESHDLRITLSEDAKKAVSDTGYDIFNAGVSLLDLGGTESSLDQIVSGFSGVYVGKLGVFGQDENGKHKSYWLLKWGKPVRMIAEEAKAHKLIQRMGIDRSLVIPQLYPNAINWGGYGFIAYAFEENALTAYEKIMNEGVISLKDTIDNICSSLYSNHVECPVSPSDIVSECWNLNDEELKIINKNNLRETLIVTKNIIHGDFHLRNILIQKSKPTLIDFACSRFAPVVIDCSKLLIDIIAFFLFDSIEVESFDWNSLENSELAPFLTVFSNYLNGKDDKKFFKISMECFALKYLQFPDVSEPAKIKIRKILE